MEVRRRYSNPPDQACDQVERLRQLLDVASTAAPDGEISTPRQVQRRLHAAEVSELVAKCQAGAEVRELAEHFRCHQDTVSKALD